MYRFGQFNQLCYDSPLPICNLYNNVNQRCSLVGFSVNGTQIRNLGDMVAAFFAFMFTLFIIWRTFIRHWAVGRSEMLIFFIGYAALLASQIVSSGGFLSEGTVLTWFTAVNLGFISAISWVLVMNAIVAFQLIDDGSVISVSGVFLGGVFLFAAVLFVAVATGSDPTNGPFGTTPRLLKNTPLFVLYIMFPLFSVAAYVILETIVVFTLLSQRLPLVYLYASALSFGVSQVFMFIASPKICEGTSRAVDGSLFSTIFVFIAVFMLFKYWATITEDEEDVESFHPETTIIPQRYPPTQEITHIPASGIHQETLSDISQTPSDISQTPSSEVNHSTNNNNNNNHETYETQQPPFAEPDPSNLTYDDNSN